MPDNYDKILRGGKAKVAAFKLGEAHFIPSSGDRQGWLDYQRKPKNYKVPTLPKGVKPKE